MTLAYLTDRLEDDQYEIQHNIYLQARIKFPGLGPSTLPYREKRAPHQVILHRSFAAVTFYYLKAPRTGTFKWPMDGDPPKQRLVLRLNQLLELL